MNIYKIEKILSSGLPMLVKECEFIYDFDIEFTSPKNVADLLNCIYDVQKKTVEEAYLLVFNSANNIIGVFKLSEGTVNATHVDPKRLFQMVFMCNGTGIILAHNHPSGNPNPSKSDILISKRIKDAAEIMNIGYLDFIIIGDEGRYCSFQEEELI